MSAIRSLDPLSARLGSALLAIGAALALVDPASAQVDGTLDLDFGGDGVVIRTDLFEESWLTDLAAGDDLLVAVGRRRYDPPPPPSTPQLHSLWWALDSSGAGAGRECAGASSSTYPFSFADSSYLETALIDSAGRLVVGGALATIGTETQDRALVARFDLTQPGCVIDDSFSGLGWELFDDDPPCDAVDCIVVDLVEQTAATGAVAPRRYVALVRAITGGLGASRFFLLGLTEGGDPDPTFSGDGWAEVTHAEFGVALHARTELAMDPQGRLYLAVTYSDPEDPLDLDVGVLRFHAGGGIDASYGTDGFFSVQPTGADPTDLLAFDVAVRADGIVLVAVRLAAIGPGGSHAVWAISPAGDVGFAPFIGTLEVARLAVQGNGRTIVVGDADAINPDTSRVLRYNTQPTSPPSMSHDFTWGTNGVASYDVEFSSGDTPDVVTAMVLWGGRVVLGGNLGASSSFVLRAKNAYVFADGFEGGTTAGW